MKKAIPSFDGGVNDVTRPDAIGDDQLKKSVNYESLKLGLLTKRREPEIHSSALNTLLGTDFDLSTPGSYLIKMSEPFYPKTKPSAAPAMLGEYMFLVFGYDKTASGYELRLYYGTNAGSTAWASNALSALATAGISYSTWTSSNEMNFFIGEDRILIADGVNPAYYVKVDQDGTILAGILGIKAPLNKATIAEITEFNETDFENTATNTRLDSPGLFQCLYTASTEAGDESNPSPLSDTHNMQFFELDTDGADTRWIDRVQINNLSIPPDLPADLLEEMKFFNVYVRIVRYGEGDTPVTLEFSQQFEIIDKTNESGTTGNNYTVTVAVSPGDIVSYDNRIAPVAQEIVELSEAVFVGNLKKRIEFPFEFQYYSAITLNNVDAKTYVDAVIHLRLFDGDHSDGNAITNLDWADFDTNDTNVIDTGRNDLRFYDQDLTTALNVVYRMDTSDNWCDVWIKIPQLSSSSARTIYLCWAVPVGGSPSVDVANLQTTATGKWFYFGNLDFENQEVFLPEKVKNANSLMCSPMDVEIVSTKVPNKVNNNFNGTLATATWKDTPVAKIPAFFSNDPNNTVGNKHINMTTAGGILSWTDFGLTELPDSMYIYGRIQYNGTNLLNGRTIVLFTKTQNTMLTFGTGGINQWNVNDVANTQFDAIPDFGVSGGTDYDYFLLWSWDGTDTSLFVIDIQTGILHSQEMAVAISGAGNASLHFGASLTFTDMKFDQWQLVHGKYLDATNLSDINTVHQIADFMPAMENIVGNNPFETDVIINGNFALGDQDWGKGTGWTIDVGNAEADCDASQGADTDLTASVEPLTIGRNYLVKYTVKNYVAGNVVAVCGTAEGTDRSANGTYYESIVADDEPFIIRGDLDFDGSVDDIKCYEISYNNNVTGFETETIEYKEYNNMIGWSNIHGFSFPNTYEKFSREKITGLLPAPSFLKQKYENTIIVFTRNNRYRFVLTGTPGSWAGSVSNMIEEYKQYGLMAPKSLVKAGASLLWLSEVGVILETSDGMQLISKNTKAITLNEDAIGFHCPVRDQYILNRSHIVATITETLITFVAAGDKILYGGSSTTYWSDAGFQKGDIIHVSGANDSENDGIFRINNVHASNKTISLDEQLVNDPTGGVAVTITTYGSIVYDLAQGKWDGDYTGMDSRIATILSGGSATDNLNLFLYSSEIYKYPGDLFTKQDAYVETKEYYIQKGIFRKYNAQFNKADITLTVNDETDVDLAAFFIGELLTAKGSTIAVSDTFVVDGSGDTTDNALQGAKGSVIVDQDVFQVSNVTTEAIVYLYNGVDITTTVLKRVLSGEEVIETDTKVNMDANRFRGIPSGKGRGRSISFKFEKAQEFKSLIFDYKRIGG